jgi:hypothetical protein
LRKKYQLGELGVDGRIILERILKRLDGDMDWIDLAQNRDRWQVIVNTAMNPRVP